jgi:D-glycero-beta-D-manno-heptose 1-phosphate adenylyltransferase
MNKWEIVQSKVLTVDELKFRLAYWNFKNQKIVFTNGCFDIIHRGHIEYLAKAASFGDFLIVGLNTDKSVKKLKGESRPVQNEESRSLQLASLSFVSAVILFDEDTPYELIKIVNPDVLIKGSDYKPEDIVGYDIVTAKNGNVITIDFVDGYSTSDLINKIKKI